MRPVSGTVKDMTESGARSPRLLRRLNAQTLLRHALTAGDFAAAEAMQVPDNTERILFEDIYVRGSEPRWMRGRTVDETFYY